MFFHLLVIFLSSSCHLLVIFLSSSCHLLVMFLSCSCHVLVMFLSCSCHVLVMFLSFLLCSKSSLFLPRLPHVFLLKLLCKKSFFGPYWVVVFHWALFFSLVYFSFCSLSSSFQVLYMFCFFPLFFLLFLYFPFVFLFNECFFLFHFVSLFSFLGCSKSLAALQDSLEKSAHSGLALFALYWLVVTFSMWNSAHSGDDQVQSRFWWAAGGSSPTFTLCSFIFFSCSFTVCPFFLSFSSCASFFF